uniref:Uncharacterized protein n=1 Tax=Molossus molossus TaxID=27622 RepID=A0A7J8HZN9_MOLMO|nr:hypothetical protein HJG59_010736 [Molossus molossus]
MPYFLGNDQTLKLNKNLEVTLSCSSVSDETILIHEFTIHYVYYVPGTLVNMSHVVTYLVLRQHCGCGYYSHFIDEDVETETSHSDTQLTASLSCSYHQSGCPVPGSVPRPCLCANTSLNQSLLTIHSLLCCSHWPQAE